MQDWQNAGQAGPPQGQGQVWQNNFGFTDENGQFSNVQGWPQTIPGQNAYGHLNDSPHQVPVTHAGSGPGAVQSLGQGGYHSGQSQFTVDEAFNQPVSAQSLPGLGYPHDVYGQQGSSAQFSQPSFQYQGQSPAGFNSHMQQQQYGDPQLLAQSRTSSQTPLAQQRFEPVQQQQFSSAHGFTQGSHPIQPQQPQQPQQQQHEPQRASHQGPNFAGSPQQYHAQHITSQSPPPYSNSTPATFHHSPPPAVYPHQQAKFVPQQLPYAPPSSSAPFQPVVARQVSDHAVQQQAMPAASQPPRILPQQAQTLMPTATPTVVDGELATVPTKQKRPTKGSTDSPKESNVPSVVSPNAATPFSTDEDLAALSQFKSRPAAAKRSFPAIQGAPFLVSPGSVNIPFAKSYDRISPLVALPSQSGKQVLPGIGHDLPCEIQGRFADKYRPSANFTGSPEDREKEAKPLIDEYQRDMKALGNRRPKYADYPFFYQEQLKADEAAKSKAQRKARKEEEEERKKPIRPPTRPADPVEAAAWDILGIVHIEGTATRTHSLIGDAVRKLGDFLIKLRGEMTKAKAEVDEEAKKNPSDAEEMVKLKKDFEAKKEAIIRACEAADKFGDDAVLENLGGNQKGCLSLVNSLITCAKAADYSGRMPKAILRFMSNISMPKKVADAVHFETVRKRFADKGDEEVKELVRTVASRIKKEAEPANGATDTKKAVASAGATVAGKSKLSAPATKSTSDVSPTKRPLEDDSDSRPGKKVNVDGSSSSLASKLGAAKAPVANTLQSKLAAPKARPVTSSLAAKNRPVPKPVAKQDPSKNDASKADGTAASTPMDVDQPTAKKLKLDAARAATASKPAASSSSLSSIGSLLESINTRKPDAQATKKDTSKNEPPETPEERAKRLRKESRRNLRVSWKPESELTQVRVFHKEAAEDENNMTQDAADDRSEGMMLKRRASFAEDDEDEEDDLPTQNDPWVTPKVADVSRIEREYRDKAFVNRGGTLEIRTDEQKAMEQREQNVLMVVYTSTADIPPTPKSPAPEPNLPDQDATVASLPQVGAQYEEIQTRLRETQQYGPDSATWSAKRRRDAKSDPATKLQSIFGNMQNSSSAEAVPEGYNYNMTPPQKHAQLAQLHAANSGNANLYVPSAEQTISLLRSDAVLKWRSPVPFNLANPKTYRRSDYPDPTFQAIANQVEDLFERYKGLPHPPSEPPKWLTDPERIREWQAGYQQDMVVRAQRQEKARAEAEATAQRAQGQPQQPSSQSNQDAWAAYYQQQAQQPQAQQQQQQDPYAMYVELYQRMQGGQTQITPQSTAPAAGPQPSQLGDAQVQALLAQINQPQHSQPNSAYNLNPNDQGYQQLMMLAQMQQQPSSQGQDQRPPARQQGELDYGEAYDGRGNDYNYEYGSSNGRDRDTDRDRDGGRDWEYRDRRDNRDRDRNDQENRRDKQEKQGKTRKGNAPGGATLPPHRPANKALIGTKPCVFWQQGKCARGDKCTFRHDN